MNNEKIKENIDANRILITCHKTDTVTNKQKDDRLYWP